VLVGHSMGGLLVRLYGQTYADQIAGIVFVDAFSPTVPTLLGDKWPIYRDRLTPPLDQQTVPALRDPNSEQIDVDASVVQVQAPPGEAAGRADQDRAVRRPRGPAGAAGQ
jgi:pimeloyl-ACP methyl ester carboxylesterase